MFTGVPTFASAIPFVILSAWLSDKYKKRGYVMAVGYTTALIGWIMVRTNLCYPTEGEISYSTEYPPFLFPTASQM